MNMIGRTQHEGTSASAQRRYDTKRSDKDSFPRTPRSKAYARTAQQEWHSIGSSALLPTQKDFAGAQVIRFEAHPRASRKKGGPARPAVKFWLAISNIYGEVGGACFGERRYAAHDPA